MPARDDAVTVKKIPNVALRTQNIFPERELEEGSVVTEYLTTSADAIQ